MCSFMASPFGWVRSGKLDSIRHGLAAFFLPHGDAERRPASNINKDCHVSAGTGRLDG